MLAVGFYLANFLLAANPCKTAPVDPANGDIMCSGAGPYTSGTSCPVKCAAGYTASSPSVTCTAGTFSTATCVGEQTCLVQTLLETTSGDTMYGLAGVYTSLDCDPDHALRKPTWTIRVTVT
jgi:hypothetical protein